ESAARDLIDEFRKTIEFAGLTERDVTLSPAYQDSEETKTPEASPTAPPARMSTKPAIGSIAGFRLPLGPGKYATLEGDFPVSEDQWDLMLRVLETMKP